jgi:hypothetical protein
VPEEAWQTGREETGAVRQSAEVMFVSDEQRSREPHRYLAIRILKQQGSLFADGSDRRHYAIVTNLPGAGLDLIHWHRQKAGSVEHRHDILTNELAAEALPSQKFGANAAWLRPNVILYPASGGTLRAEAADATGGFTHRPAQSRPGGILALQHRRASHPPCPRNPASPRFGPGAAPFRHREGDLAGTSTTLPAV